MPTIDIEKLYNEIQKILQKLEILREAVEELRMSSYVPNEYGFPPPDSLW